MMSDPKLMSDDEERCLVVLGDRYHAEVNCLYFRFIASMTSLPWKQVRRACRALARRGFTKYERGLLDDEGAAGSGYRCTGEGLRALEET